MHNSKQPHDGQRIDLGVASEETKGAEGPIMDTNQAQQRIPGISAD